MRRRRYAFELLLLRHYALPCFFRRDLFSLISLSPRLSRHCAPITDIIFAIDCFHYDFFDAAIIDLLIARRHYYCAIADIGSLFSPFRQASRLRRHYAR